MANDVRVVSDSSLQGAGFSDAEIAAASGNADGYVGDRGGVKYYRAQNEMNIELGDYKTRDGRLPDQFGDRT